MVLYLLSKKNKKAYRLMERDGKVLKYTADEESLVPPDMAAIKEFQWGKPEELENVSITSAAMRLFTYHNAEITGYTEIVHFFRELSQKTKWPDKLCKNPIAAMKEGAFIQYRSALMPIARTVYGIDYRVWKENPTQEELNLPFEKIEGGEEDLRKQFEKEFIDRLKDLESLKNLKM